MPDGTPRQLGIIRRVSVTGDETAVDRFRRLFDGLEPLVGHPSGLTVRLGIRLVDGLESAQLC